MKIYLEKAIFVNRAPFAKLELSFCENEIAVFSSANGKGKTTILSHIVDAFHEMARPHFPNEFEGKENKIYRVSSVIYNLNSNLPSFVYLRFKTSDEFIDYVDVRNICTEDQYNEAISLENKIPFAKIKPQLDEGYFAKCVSKSFDKKKAFELFSKNILTYFPSYRYEMPGYLNDAYKIQLNFRKKSGFSGDMRNPIEVISGLPDFANWVMDVVLDLRTGAEQNNQILFENLNSIVTHALFSKNCGNLRFGVGPRGFGGTRIQILENVENGKQVYPTIFNLSSGESSMLCLFGELLRQADNIKNNILCTEITGIVLIDEIDKHLHIKLQKEILPSLMKFFPNVQFLVSSHSPFFSMGLAEVLQERSKILDLESGLSIEPTNEKQFQEVYEMMVGENERYKKMYDSIKSQIDNGKELQIITEGKNTEHIIKAISILDNNLLGRVKFITGAEDKTGDQQLKNAFDIMSNTSQIGKFLFVWDCDSGNKANTVTESVSFYKFCLAKNESNTKVQKGIENLYPENYFSEELYDVKETPTDYGGSKTETKFNKARFVEKIKEETNVDVFANYAPLLEKIKSIIDPSV